MKLLPKPLRKETFDYVSDKYMKDLKSEMQQLFEQTNGWNSSVNLIGEFVSEFKFRITPKWQMTHISGGKAVAILDGELFQHEPFQTKIKFTVKPSPIFTVFFLAFMIFGVLGLRTNNVKGDIAELRIASAISFLVVPILMLLFGHFSKQGLKERFIRVFDLKPIR